MPAHEQLVAIGGELPRLARIGLVIGLFFREDFATEGQVSAGYTETLVTGIDMMGLIYGYGICLSMRRKMTDNLTNRTRNKPANSSNYFFYSQARL
ncbi:MAG: hypothetical protein A4E47_00156 [Methanosaeta sp. PtaU1.Bin028]|nr:MAG: hypothetical protein A4E47_00156 [Methanosaeta sp. PtaU1.Bin028]